MNARKCGALDAEVGDAGKIVWRALLALNKGRMTAWSLITQTFPVLGPSISIIATNELFRRAAPVMRHFDALPP